MKVTALVLCVNASLPHYVTYAQTYFGNRKFELTVFTTFEQYVSAVNSEQVHFEQLLPLQFPLIRIRFRYESFEIKFHRNCPGEGKRHGKIYWNFKDI